MSWGYKIAFAYGSFVIMILFFLFVATRQSNELVEDHYYEKELKFQNSITASDNLRALNIKPSIDFENKLLRITLPSQISAHVSNGKIEFIRMSDQTKDISTEFTPDENKSFSLPADKFKTGIYTLRIEWKDGNIPYLYENQFSFPKS